MAAPARPYHHPGPAADRGLSPLLSARSRRQPHRDQSTHRLKKREERPCRSSTASPISTRTSPPGGTRSTLIPKPPSRKSAPRISSDRKSTRLNSSHPSISYAVFCLKKKK